MTASANTPLRSVDTTAADATKTTKVDPVQVEDTVVVTERVPGFFGRIGLAMKKHPIVTTIVTLGAAGGAAFVAYEKVLNGADADEIADVAEKFAAAVSRLRS